MIGIDTNVLVRYLTQDDAGQSKVATRFIEQVISPDNPGLITGITLCELVWVLSDCYAADQARIQAVIEGLLSSKQLNIESPELVWGALRDWTEFGADFSDALIGRLVLAQGGASTVTFDRAASKLPGFQLLK
jgi:predicted nucleic-acid-binding protein